MPDDTGTLTYREEMQVHRFLFLLELWEASVRLTTRQALLLGMVDAEEYANEALYLAARGL